MQIPGACFCLVKPTPVDNPVLVAVSWCALGLLDIAENLYNAQEFADYFSGNKKIPGSEFAAHCYCGHQFGTFAGQLGDGASMYVGEIVNKFNQKWEIQLKGAGITPFSRLGDGRKVLRSSIREFLCSEAMYHLGIPTTRAGTLVATDTITMRDKFYNGRSRPEKCAIVLRIAPSFLRFGSYEIFKTEDPMTNRAGPSVGRVDILKKMLDFTISTYYPHIVQQSANEAEAYLKFYEEVCDRTAYLVSLWQCVGFCHGVLNTDNMSVLGITIDYGPFGFLDRYIPDYISNSADDSGRYSYRRQPEMCCWNLRKFADALKLCIPTYKTVEILNNTFYQKFHLYYFSKMRKKLGLIVLEKPEDEKLILDFLQTMEDTSADFTNAFRSLSLSSLPGMSDHSRSFQALLTALLRNCAKLEVLKAVFRTSYDLVELRSLKSLTVQNPHGPLMKQLEKAEKLEEIKNLTEPALLELNKKKWIVWLNHYKQRLLLESKDCSNLALLNKERKKIMNATNPKYILRTYIAENAITQAERGNYLEVQNLLRRLQNPYCDDEECFKQGPHFGFNNVIYDAVPPLSEMDVLLS